MNSSRKDRIKALKKALRERVLVLDGAMGTAIQGLNLTAIDFGGPDLEGCNENLVFSAPQIILDIHQKYLLAGADIIETNTFGATPIVLDEYQLGKVAEPLNHQAASLARQAADSHGKWVAGSMGPTTKSLTVTGGASFEEMIQNYYLQAKGLHRGGVDFFLLETCQDTRNVKAGLLAIEKLHLEVGEEIPVAVSCTIEPMGTMLAGQSIEAFLVSLMHKDLLYLGLNCATGPEFMTEHLRSLSKICPFPVACVPNAGLPDEDGRYLETPEMISKALERFGQEGWLNLVGGCCGTHYGHIEGLSKMAAKLKPRTLPKVEGSYLSGVDFLEVTEDQRPVLVGERTNVIGSKKFKDLIIAEKFDEAAEVGQQQCRRGASIIDCCLANPDRDELDDMNRFLGHLIKRVRTPLMIDSTDEKVIEEALTFCQGKSIINSINLEEGEDRFKAIAPLVKEFGAALVVGCIDEKGMAVDRNRKLEVAKRSFDLLTSKYGISPFDIYWDPLVFPCATGDQQYLGSAVETIEAIRLIKNQFPQSKTILGISNVSFGLPPLGREVLNSVFLYHCVQSGLDLAIVNSEKLIRYPSLDTEEVKLADNLLWNRGSDPIAAFAEKYRGAKREASKPLIQKSLEERLAQYILEGTREGLIEDLAEALKKSKPLEIINGPLMKGMDEVGRLFNSNQLIVAEVLQSAESMKTAVAYLERFMEKNQSANRGKMILATVKGDVHDIGKNLVEIIFSNNGFEVVNLGIKVPPEQIIAAVREHNPDFIGLSGLLVKSAQQMVSTADDLSKAGIHLPMLVGGAALSRNFTDKRIAPAYVGGTVEYAGDAMKGLELAKALRSEDSFTKLKAELELRRKSLQPDLVKKPGSVREVEIRPLSIRELSPSEIPKAPDFDRHSITNTPLDHIWAFLNPRLFYGKHLGVKGPLLKLIEAQDWKSLETTKEGQKARELVRLVDELKLECRSGLMKPKAIYQFIQAKSRGNHVSLAGFDLKFPRQDKPDGLCLSDYVAADGDNLAMFVTTAGEGIRDLSEKYKQKGQYLRSHVIQAFALETAEAYAEYLHSRIRSLWGFADPLTMSMMDRFQAKYRGRRYSFGYPACPNLEDQKVLFDILRPQEIGVELTDGFMMDPEASVSAVVLHHPQAIYFSVGGNFDGPRGIAEPS